VGNDKVFALDIGTRKIVGLVMQKKAANYHVLGSEMIEHKTRAMLDGQIHDVEAVAGTILQIKSALENKLQMRLNSAAVAAAGRALKTARGSARKNRTLLYEISREEVRALEIEAVQQAQYLLAQEEMKSKEKNSYFCVGYSVSRYYMENQEIGNLVGHVASEIAAEVIATFLPRVVVDSLFSALKKAGLEIYSLTLEPIAALSLAISPSMRLLNLALVDIGAGTSDIAVVKDRNIFAYAMVPFGGDELTESIASHYLLDFNSAEIVKRRLLSDEEIDVVDVLGNKLQLSSEEIKQSLMPMINELAEKVSLNILEINQKAPDAVICVGGGSMTPSLTGCIADKLGIPVNRVGLRTPESFEDIEVEAAHLKGPQGVTPLGIAYNSLINLPVPFIKVTVNKRELALWNVGEISVANALLNSGILLADIYGKPGMGKTVEINGCIKVIKGEMGSPPLVKVNGEQASLETILKDGDEIEFHKGQDGKDACITVKDLISSFPDYVVVNGENIQLQPTVTVNGTACDFDTEVPDRARVEFRPVSTLKDVLKIAGVSDYLLESKNYHYYLDGEKKELEWIPITVKVNGEKAYLDQKVKSGTEISYTIGKEYPRIKDLNLDDYLDLKVKVNGKEVCIRGKGALIKMNEEIVTPDEVLKDGASIVLDKNRSTAILSDIFQVIEIEPAASGKLTIKLNGEPAGFTTPINNNSNIELLWER